MELPLAYVEKMKALLGEEYEKYAAALRQTSYNGLRVNTLKITPQDFCARECFSLSPIPWCETGFYYKEGERPGKHPYYHAGLYYLQEPSAMSPAAILPINPGERVLDLCAAPGGKATQLAARLGGEGILVANDISAGRARALLKNIELSGIRNSMVFSEAPERLAERFAGYFDKILVDAPCSGEGMFRREPDMLKSWQPDMLAFCRTQQEKILEACAKMLRPGGMLLYSTCTFSVEENEGSIGRFLERHAAFSLCDIEKAHGFASGVGDFSQCARLYPHRLAGEGHFLALLQRADGEAQNDCPPEADEKAPDAFLEFAAETLRMLPEGIYKVFGESLYLLPKEMPSAKGLRALRTGWQLGELKKGRFQPAQAFAMGLRKEDVTNTADFSLEDTRVIRYLKGETVEAEGRDGWTLVCVDGFPLGWAKRQRGRLKNKYAVSWKWE